MLGFLALVLATLAAPANDPSNGLSSILITPQGGPPSGRAGTAVAASGNLLVVGAPGGSTHGDQVYVYRRPPFHVAHVREASFGPVSDLPGTSFGISVAADDVAGLIAVGASTDKARGSNAGAVHVYRRNSSGTWVPLGKVHASDTDGGDLFGYAVDIDYVSANLTRIVVGAPFKEGGTHRGAAYVFGVSANGTITQEARLPDQNVASGHSVGFSVSIDGGRAAVGVILNNILPADGAVHVFDASGTTWSQSSKVTLNESVQVREFGRSVSVESDRLAVGAPDHTSAGLGTGAAYVYARSGNGWTQQQRYLGSAAQDRLGAAVDLTNVAGTFYLAAGAPKGEYCQWTSSDGNSWPALATVVRPDGSVGNEFGCAVAWAVPALAVGAFSDDTAASNAGATYAFDSTSTTWTWVKHLPEYAGYNEEFGSSIAVDGDVAVIGAREDDDLTHEGGAAYVWERVGGTWTQEAKLDAGGIYAVPYALLGSSVAVSGDTIAVGAPSEGLNAGSTVDGAAYVYRRPFNDWIFEQRIPALSSNVRCGEAVAVEGIDLLVGAPGGDEVYSLYRSGSTWFHGPRPVAPDTSSGDDFGAAVALKGGTAVVGAPRHDFPGKPDAGAAYVFQRAGASWTYVQKLTSSFFQGGERFGSVVALDDQRIVVSAPLDDASGTDAGAVYAFKRTGSTWAFESSILPSAAVSNYRFGHSIDIDGNQLAVGARLDGSSSVNGGAAHIYRYTGILWTRDLTLPDVGLQAADARGNACAWSGNNELMVGAPGRDAGFPDSGAVELWNLPAPDLVYCTGKTNSSACAPFMSLLGRASATSSTGFYVSGWNLVPNEPGFLLYGFSKGNLDFHGGKLCVKLPFRRLLPPKAAQAFGPPPCTGMLDRNFNNRIQSGVDPLLTVGQRVFAQWRLRDPNDPTGFGDGFTDAVRFTVCP